MHRLYQFLVLYFIIGCQWSVADCYAQEPENMNKELILVRPYEPSVTDAQKINTLPNLKDSFNIRPSSDYSIHSRRIDTRFDVSPVGAARLQPLPQTRLYRGYIKLGVGTVPNPLAEVALNTLRNKKYSAGALLKYDAALGKVKLDNGKKVFAGYGESGAKIFGQKFFRSSYLYGDAGVSRQTAYHYGYDTGLGIDTSFVKGDIRARYTFADASIGVRSSQFKTDRLNFDLKLGYHHAHHKSSDAMLPDNAGMPSGTGDVKYGENAINVKAELDNNMFGGNVNAYLFNRSNAFDSLRNSFAVDLNPWFVLDNDSLRLEAGIRAAVYKEGNRPTQFKIFPKIEFQFTLFKDAFIPYVGLDGYIEPNTYRDIIGENPFITPGLVVPATNTQLLVYGGLKGSLTSKLSYHLRVDFTTSDSEHLFVNDTTYSHVQNHFSAVVDDVNTLGLKGELYYNPVESLDLGLKASYYSYQPSTEKYAWHKPGFMAEFLVKYNLRDKILVNFDLIGLGKRYAKVFFDPEKEYTTLGSVVDMNFGVEYRYTKSLSFFLKLNNLTGAKYYRWNYYPSQRFNAMAGFTYSL